jgi:hypothetical protein
LIGRQHYLGSGPTVNEASSIGDEPLIVVRLTEKVQPIYAITMTTWSLDKHYYPIDTHRSSNDQFSLSLNTVFDICVFGVGKWGSHYIPLI